MKAKRQSAGGTSLASVARSVAARRALSSRWTKTARHGAPGREREAEFQRKPWRRATSDFPAVDTPSAFLRKPMATIEHDHNAHKSRGASKSGRPTGWCHTRGTPGPTLPEQVAQRKPLRDHCQHSRRRAGLGVLTCGHRWRPRLRRMNNPRIQTQATTSGEKLPAPEQLTQPYKQLTTALGAFPKRDRKKAAARVEAAHQALSL